VRRVLPLLYASIFFLLPSYAAAQQFTQLSGLIRDSSGAVVPGASITVVSEDTGFRRSTVSQSNGAYVVASLHPGPYRITVRKTGFRTFVRLGLKLDAAVPARLDFILSVGSMQEQITVTGSGSGSPFAVEDSSLGALVGRDWIERLPLNGRGLLSLLELAPGAIVTPATRGEAGQFTVNGQRPNSHSFTVDGLSVNSGVSGGAQPAKSTGGSLPGMTAFGSFHQLIASGALDEFRIQTSSFSSDFGKLPGAQVSMSSRAGSNQFHGSALYFFRDGRADANDWFSNRAGLDSSGARLRSFGSTLGGPIRPNRAFFFLAYENMRLRQPLLWRAAVPAPEAKLTAPEWAHPLLDLFPSPNGPALGHGLADWLGQSYRPSRLDSASLRLDHSLTSRLTFFGRYTRAPSYAEFGNAQINRLAMRYSSFTGGVNAILGAAFVSDSRFSVSDTSGDSDWRLAAGSGVPSCYIPSLPILANERAASCNSFFQLSIGGLERLLSGQESHTRQSHWQLLETVALTRGSHHLRFGFDLRKLSPSRSRSVSSIQVQADSLRDLYDRRNVWVITTPPDAGRIVLSEYSAFALDSFRVNPQLTVTYGLRWEFNPSPISYKPVSGLEASGGVFSPSKGIPIWQANYSNFAPRAGFAYRLRRDSSTLLRAGIGLYYDASLAAATDLVNGGPSNLWQFGNPSSPSTGPLRTILSFGFSPELHWPLVRHWNVSLEHPLSPSQLLTASYLGSAGRSLLRREIAGEPQFSLVQVALTANHAVSDYHAFQFQYRRPLSKRLQALASYTWSHSIDTGSSDSALHWLGLNHWSLIDRGSSDFDVRHSLHMAFSFQLRRWSLDGVYRARTGFPVSVLNAEHAMGVTFANVFRPDSVPGQAPWIIDPAAPAGRRLNRAAFQPRPGLEQGSLGRNAIPGLGMSQLDLALRRDFPLSDRLSLRLRLEAFNLLNQANLSDPVRFLNNPLFGESASMLNLMLGSGTAASGLSPMLQTGGPRSLQLSLGLHF
jgi:hypothetical protein